MKKIIQAALIIVSTGVAGGAMAAGDHMDDYASRQAASHSGHSSQTDAANAEEIKHVPLSQEELDRREKLRRGL